MSTLSIPLRKGPRTAAAAAVLAVLALLLVLAAKWAAGHAIALNAEETEVAALGTGLAGADPHAHYAHGLQLQKTLEPGDQEKALREFETAVSLSPHNYVFRLALGRAYEQAGEAERAEREMRKALELAPNYARVHWALGNFLVRRGITAEGFAEIRKAVEADAAFSDPAAGTAWQIFGGDVGRIVEIVGESPRINGSIAALLAGGKRYPESLEVWRRIPLDEKRTSLKETGQLLFNRLHEAGLYRSAIDVGGEASILGADEAAVGRFSNGGFESSIAAKPSNPFTWNIADGTFPRIGLSENQKRSGSYSLLISFGQGGKGSREVAQRLGVEPGGRYELQFFYRSEVKSPGLIRCDVAPGEAGGGPLGGTDLKPTADWVEVRVPVTVPGDVEGLIVKFTTQSCPPEGCSGNIWMDDFALLKQ